MIEIRYVLQIEDFMDSVRASYASDKRGKRVRMAMSAIGIAIVPLVFDTKSFGEGSGLSYWMIPLGLGLAWYGLFPARRLKAFYQKCVTGEEVTGQFDDARMVTFSATARTEILWSAFDSWIEGQTTFAIYAANVMYVLPKRAFSDESCAEFRRLLSEKIRARTR